MSKTIVLQSLSEQEIIQKIKENSDNLGIVYKKCKSNCFYFMRKIASQLNDEDLQDIYQDAILILYEKIVHHHFELTCTFQTYLNSVCRFQLLNRLNKSGKQVKILDNDSDDDENNSFSYLNITDSLDAIENSQEPYFLAIEKALQNIKNAGGNCYELLTLFWYHKKSMNELTSLFGYQNSDTTKNQKAKCQKRLEKLAYAELNN